MKQITDTPAPAGGQFGALAAAAFNGTMSDRLRKVLATYMIVGSTLEVGKRWWKATQEKMTHTVTVFASDDIYGDVHAWLLDRIPSSRRRSLTAQSRRNQGEMIASPDGGLSRVDDAPTLTLLYDGGRQVVDLEGHRIAVHVDKPQFDMSWLRDDTSWSRIGNREHIVFTATSIDGREAVLRFLQEIADNHYRVDRPPTIYMGTRYGDWQRRRDLPRRHLDTVVLRAGQREELVADLAEFLRREDDYARLGIPWHRGYLFEGPPGTGKTSLARALSSHFNIDVYYVPLSDIDSDTYLMQLIGRVEPRSMLLLEDIDVVDAASDRSDATNGITLSGLLNSIDGVATSHGLITVMTTNDAPDLDSGLVRPGRIDRIEHIGMLDTEQLDRLVTVFAGRPAGFDVHVPDPDSDHGLSPATVIELFKHHFDDTEAALTELKALLDG